MTVAQDGLDGEAARELGDAHRQLLTDNAIQFELPTSGYVPASESVPAPQASSPISHRARRQYSTRYARSPRAGK